MNEKMNIVWKKLDELKPYENNPRFNDEAVPAVAESIKEFGWKQPLVVDRDGVIVAGHTRYKAAEKLGLDKVPCIIADDLTPEQIKAFRLADNKTGEIATWDFDLLDQELADLDFDMSDFGFDFGASAGSLSEEPTQRIEAGGEIDTSDFVDDKFSCTCPKC
ncbi:MAG: ParB N-terminal domain-containing protein, partial [Synergistaceae bacterium]|nr:ParB N-terminal domain-containing protein [Synergistaceae bacterium]